MPVSEPEKNAETSRSMTSVVQRTQGLAASKYAWPINFRPTMVYQLMAFGNRLFKGLNWLAV
jgi:hypothetical protein